VIALQSPHSSKSLPSLPSPGTPPPPPPPLASLGLSWSATNNAPRAVGFYRSLTITRLLAPLQRKLRGLREVIEDFMCFCPHDCLPLVLPDLHVLYRVFLSALGLREDWRRFPHFSLLLPLVFLSYHCRKYLSLLIAEIPKREGLVFLTSGNCFPQCLVYYDNGHCPPI